MNGTNLWLFEFIILLHPKGKVIKISGKCSVMIRRIQSNIDLPENDGGLRKKLP